MNEVAAIRHPVDDSLAIPLYHQVYLILKEGIRSGTYGAGSALPIEPNLCEEFGVSRITVKRAMRELVADGLVIRQRGKGTFVAEDATAPARDALDDLLQSVQAIGAATDVQHLASDIQTPSTDVAAKLGLELEAKVLRSNQLRLANDEPLAVIIAFVPEAIARQLDPKTENLPMLVRLNMAGVPVARAEQEVTATLADPTIAAPLGLEVGAPLLKLTRLVFDDTGHPVEWLTSFYRGDRYAMRTSLTHE
ncbi:MAG: UTRA domain-containing protein, partial [Alphaproteobacteria bacterium]|nr:UTRA domain-containing protein [Alphaproteobacteria bacterium]